MIFQELLDQMDEVDFICDVYAKGDALLQTVSDPFKFKLENQLAKFEKDWAEFCGALISCSNSLQEEMNSDDKSGRRGETCKALKVYEEKLGDFQCKLDAIVSVSSSLQDLSMKMNDVQVCCKLNICY